MRSYDWRNQAFTLVTVRLRVKSRCYANSRAKLGFEPRRAHFQAARSSCSISRTTSSARLTGLLLAIAHLAVCSISFLYREGIRSQGISLAQGLASFHLARAALRYCCPRDVSTIGSHPYLYDKLNCQTLVVIAITLLCAGQGLDTPEGSA